MAATISINPQWQPVAFKEWQPVCDVLASGTQSILLRKGGIAEGKKGFQWLHGNFFFMPTRFHEQADQLKPFPGGSPGEPAGGNPDEISLSLFAKIKNKGRLTEWSAVEKLDAFHIWKEETIRSRFEWGDEHGISWAEVEVWKLPVPWLLKNRKEFGGCRSWIDLPAAEEGGFFEKLKTAEKVECSVVIPDWLKATADV